MLWTAQERGEIEVAVKSSDDRNVFVTISFDNPEGTRSKVRAVVDIREFFHVLRGRVSQSVAVETTTHRKPGASKQ